MSHRDDDLTRLVDLYATMRAYDEVANTCTLNGFSSLVEERRAAFLDELKRFVRRYHSRAESKELAAAYVMDCVLNRYNQLSIWSVGTTNCRLKGNR